MSTKKSLTLSLVGCLLLMAGATRADGPSPPPPVPPDHVPLVRQVMIGTPEAVRAFAQLNSRFPWMSPETSELLFGPAGPRFPEGITDVQRANQLVEAVASRLQLSPTVSGYGDELQRIVAQYGSLNNFLQRAQAVLFNPFRNRALSPLEAQVFTTMNTPILDFRGLADASRPLADGGLVMPKLYVGLDEFYYSDGFSAFIDRERIRIGAIVGENSVLADREIEGFKVVFQMRALDPAIDPSAVGRAEPTVRHEFWHGFTRELARTSSLHKHIPQRVGSTSTVTLIDEAGAYVAGRNGDLAAGIADLDASGYHHPDRAGGSLRAYFPTYNTLAPDEKLRLVRELYLRFPTQRMNQLTLTEADVSQFLRLATERGAGASVSNWLNQIDSVYRPSALTRANQIISNVSERTTMMQIMAYPEQGVEVAAQVAPISAEFRPGLWSKIAQSRVGRVLGRSLFILGAAFSVVESARVIDDTAEGRPQDAFDVAVVIGDDIALAASLSPHGAVPAAGWAVGRVLSYPAMLIMERQIALEYIGDNIDSRLFLDPIRRDKLLLKYRNGEIPTQAALRQQLTAAGLIPLAGQTVQDYINSRYRPGQVLSEALSRLDRARLEAGANQTIFDVSREQLAADLDHMLTHADRFAEARALARQNPGLSTSSSFNYEILWDRVKFTDQAAAPFYSWTEDPASSLPSPGLPSAPQRQLSVNGKAIDLGNLPVDLGYRYNGRAAPTPSFVNATDLTWGFARGLGAANTDFSAFAPVTSRLGPSDSPSITRGVAVPLDEPISVIGDFLSTSPWSLDHWWQPMTTNPRFVRTNGLNDLADQLSLSSRWNSPFVDFGRTYRSPFEDPFDSRRFSGIGLSNVGAFSPSPSEFWDCYEGCVMRHFVFDPVQNEYHLDRQFQLQDPFWSQSGPYDFQFPTGSELPPSLEHDFGGSWDNWGVGDSESGGGDP